MKRLIAIVVLGVFTILVYGETADRDALLTGYFPENPWDMTTPTSYDDMRRFLEEASGQELVRVVSAGRSVEGRSILLVELRHPDSPSLWKVLFYAQQHGDEPAGKDALLFLIRDLLRDPSLLDPRVALWILPMVNPDGAEANRRTNASGADLNRDHVLLEQPETRILHRLARRVLPHVMVDCHEFNRASRSYTGKGWLEWPDIMMDCANHPLYGADLYRRGIEWVQLVAGRMESRGHRYTRYYVGGPPPDHELRYSTPEINDGRNGLAGYGGLSFIIESGKLEEGNAANLGKRVQAYLDLLRQFVDFGAWRKRDIALVERTRRSRIPAFIPVNYFWASDPGRMTTVKVVDRKSGEAVNVETANFMKRLVVKQSVATPSAYVIEADEADVYKQLLKRHDLPYKVFETEGTLRVQGARLLRIENEFDDIYNRYGGRQIVEPLQVEIRTFPVGCVWVPLDHPDAARAAAILEPLKMYGLYAYEAFRNTVADDGCLPVWRVLDDQ